MTQHRLALPGRALAFTATAGHLTLVDPQGAPQAEYGFVAYALDGAEPRTRPVTFVINGGPGASSAYLHLLALGPWRLPVDGQTISPSMPTERVPNAETWLDFTDLVFIDPPGSGYSRVVGGDQARERFYSVEGDIDGLAAFVARWLKEKSRLESPKFFVGESYGGFRGPLLAQKLQRDQGVGLSGLVLVSPVLDFGWFSQPNHAPWVHVVRLPSGRRRDGGSRRGWSRAPAGGGALCLGRVPDRPHAGSPGQGGGRPGQRPGGGTHRPRSHARAPTRRPN